MNYFNYIAKLNLKKYKKSYISLFIVVILACTFTITIAIFNDSLLKTEEQQRQSIYGSWHISVYNTDDTLYRDLLHHGTIRNVGKMKVYGNVLGSDGSTTGAIGSADENTLKMGISLMDGSFPQNDNEIAVEMSYLSMLGISYELGQSIPLKIQVYDKDSKKTEVIEKTYILSGVLKNYTSLWKTEGNPLVSFLVTDRSLKGGLLTEHVFGTLKKEYVKNADELAILTEDRGSFYENDYTYYEYTANKQSRYESFLSGSLLILIVTLTSAFFIFNIFYTSLKEHNKSFIIMRSLGASKYEISVLYCKELIFVLTLSFSAGISTGLLASLAAYQAVKHFMVKDFVFDFNPAKIILLLGVMIFCVFLFAVFSVSHIRKMPLTGDINLQPDNKMSLKHKRKFKPLTVRNMVKIFNSAHRMEAVVYFLLTTGTFLVLASTFYRSYQKYIDYKAIVNTYTEDYGYGIMNSYFEPKSHLEETEVEKIGKIYGIDYIRAYRCSNYLPVSWEGMGSSDYALFLKSSFFPKYAGNAGVYATVYGISDKERDYKFYFDEVDEGKVSGSEFLKGNEAILYLPAFYKTGEGRMLSNINWVNPFLKSTYDVIHENTIKPGDEVVIKGARGNVAVKVSGIIYDFKKKSSQSFLGKPFSIICNDSLYDKLMPEDQKKTYEYLRIYADKNANYERTDVEISKIKDNFYFRNYRQQKEMAKYDTLASIVISLALCLLSLFIIVTVQYNNQVSKMESDYRRNYILSVLGMDKWKIQLIYLYNILKNNIFAAVIGFLVMYSYQIIMYIKASYITGANNGAINVESYVFRQYFSSLPWVYIGIFTLAYLFMNVLIAYFPLKKYRKLIE